MLLLSLATAAYAARPAPAPAADEAPPPLVWTATDATYTLTIPPDGPLTVTLEWRLDATVPAWAELPLVGPALVVRAATGPVVAGPAGLFAVLSPTASRAVRVTGTLDPSSPGAASLRVLPAARQRVVVVAPGLDVTVAGAIDGHLAAADTLDVTWAPARGAEAPAPAAPLVRAEASTAVWAEPGALLSRTVARWVVLRGAAERFELDVAGLEDVEVEGPVARTERVGDRLVLVPRAPVKGVFEARIRARRPVADDREVAAPAPRPVASRVTRHYTLGRAEDGELVPLGGPRAVPARAVPAWGRGLSDTPVVSTWEGDAPLRVRLARFSPLMGPDTVVERAQLVFAGAVEGRALVRTTWHVRNERKQYLRVTPPPGMRAVTVRVSGEPVLALSDGSTGLYVPLEKSVETVRGLLTFPVEVTWISEGPEWARSGERILELPTIDAPIQTAEWEVHLPRGVTAAGATSAPPPAAAEAGEAALQSAVSAYKKNDFRSSSALLEQARRAGNTSANIERLQSNLDALLAKDTSPDDVATRRVRDLAAARTVEQRVEQEKKTEEARKAYEAGDEDRAEAYLEEVVALADDLAVTEQEEATEQADKKAQALDLLARVKSQKAAKDGTFEGAGGAPPPQRPPARPSVAPTRGPTEAAPRPVRDDEAFAAEVVDGARVTPAGGTRVGDPADGLRETPIAAPTPGAAALGWAPEAPSPPGVPDASAAEPAPYPRPEPDARPALAVKAAPLTLALPVGGAVVRVTTALLPAGEAPALRLPYRMTGAPR